MSQSPPATRNAGHVIIAAAIGTAGSIFGFVMVAIAAAALSGRTVAGGERAVMFAAVADIAIVLGSTIALAYYARNATPLARWFTVAGYTLADLVAGAGMLLLTIVMLNR